MRQLFHYVNEYHVTPILGVSQNTQVEQVGIQTLQRVRHRRRLRGGDGAIDQQSKMCGVARPTDCFIG